MTVVPRRLNPVTPETPDGGAVIEKELVYGPVGVEAGRDNTTAGSVRQPPRRSTRPCHQPVRLEDYDCNKSVTSSSERHFMNKSNIDTSEVEKKTFSVKKSRLAGRCQVLTRVRSYVM